MIGDAALMGNIALLQSYFTLNQQHTEAAWDYIVKVGLQCVLDELELRNWSSACQMMKNLVS